MQVIKNIFLGIFTLGFYFLCKAKKNKANNNALFEGKIPFKIDDFIAMMGGIDNIISTEATLSKIKIIIKDKSLVNQKYLKRNSTIKGVFATSNSISCVVGNSANLLSKKITEKINQKY